MFFAVGDEHLSVAEIAQATVKYIGKGKVVFVDWPTGAKSVDVGNAVLTNSKIKSILGWVPKVSLADGFAKTKLYFEKHLNSYLR